MSQNCQTYSTSRDANNNTLYHAPAAPRYSPRTYTPPAQQAQNYHQVTAKVLFGSVKAINDLKRPEAGRDERRKH